MRKLFMTTLLAAAAVPLAGCVVNPPQPDRVVVREPAPPTTTYVTPVPPSTTYVAPPPRAPSVTVSPY